MPKPSDDLTDNQIHQGLTTGEYQGRDALVAEEILRRRHEERLKWKISAWFCRRNRSCRFAVAQSES